MRLSAPIFHLKRQAKQMARTDALPLAAALDRVAAQEGFQSWSHLAATHQAGSSPAQRFEQALRPGSLGLIAARPRQGKTLLALEVLAAAGGGHVFTLDFTEVEVTERYAQVGGTAPLVIDTSDGICADHIIGRLEGRAEGHLSVIDFLQILDQRRSTPPLSEQVAALARFAQRSGARILCISQIDRRFDRAKGPPDHSDIRLPNPVDLSLFARTCFLQDGQIEII